MNMEDLSARMAELSSSVDGCLWKENRTGERLASTNITITRIICTNTSLRSLVTQVYKQNVTYKL